MRDDPKGLYALLEVDPRAPPAAIAAAFRRKARVLHPDVAGTGDAAAFIRVKEAYDILSDEHRRAAYDRAARIAAEEAAPRPFEPEPEPVIRGPRFSDISLPVWLAFGGLFCLAAFMAVVELNRATPVHHAPTIRPFAPTVPSAPAPTPAPLPAVPAPGAATHYVSPNGSDAILFRYDAGRSAYVPVARLPPFNPVEAVRLIPQHGLMEIRLVDGSLGFVEASRLTPGDSIEAQRAYCAYNAGPPPQNGEVLSRVGSGGGHLNIENRSPQSVVIKLRNSTGTAVTTVFVAPGGHTTVSDLPDAVYRPDFAIGELWSRACGIFAAGMRAQRFAGYASLSGLSPLVIPPLAPATDISDATFGR